MDRRRVVRVAVVTGELLAFDGLAELPADALALLAAGAAEDFQFGAAWFGAVAAAALPPGARPRLLLYREAGRAVTLLMLQAQAGRLAGLTTPYTTRFRPPTAPGADADAPRRAGAAFGRACRAAGPLRLDCLEADWPGLPPLLAGLRDAGLVALAFDHFGNWHGALPAEWGAYLAERPSALRATIKRRLASATRDPSIVFEAIDGGAALADGLAAYESVHARSWKQAEPFPHFTAALLPAAAAAGALRLGVLRQGGAAVAAQYWLLAGGTATVLKLAHDEAAKAISPGTVLTALMIRRLIEQDRATALDFGRGDDAYKAGWTGQRRQRIGVLLCSPWDPAGLTALARHAAGKIWRNASSRKNVVSC